MLLDEPEILDGSRAWATTQELFAGVPDPLRAHFSVTCGWYEPPVGEFEGAFALIREGSPLEEFVGEVIQVDYESRSISVYVTGGSSDIDHDLALYRYAFLKLHPLSDPGITVNIRPVTPA